MGYLQRIQSFDLEYVGGPVVRVRKVLTSQEGNAGAIVGGQIAAKDLLAVRGTHNDDGVPRIADVQAGGSADRDVAPAGSPATAVGELPLGTLREPVPVSRAQLML